MHCVFISLNYHFSVNNHVNYVMIFSVLMIFVGSGSSPNFYTDPDTQHWCISSFDYCSWTCHCLSHGGHWSSISRFGSVRMELYGIVALHNYELNGSQSESTI